MGQSTTDDLRCAPNDVTSTLRIGRPLAIIPAYNEEGAIERTLTELRAVRPDVDLLVIDDGSRDGTARLARAAGAAVLVLPFNLGIGGALRAGFRWALENGYSTAFQFDADGQHDPTEVELLLAQLDRGANLVIGSRFRDAGPGYDVGRIRRRAMGSLRLTSRMLLGRSFTDTSSGFRSFDRPMMEFFARSYPDEYMESVEALFAAYSQGYTVIEVPARMRIRSAGVASNRQWRLAYHFLRLYLVLLSSARFRRPRPIDRSSVA